MFQHIGIDLDNTIINYQRVFYSVAVKLGMLPHTLPVVTKTEVKQRIKEALGEQSWMRLQGQVYGRYIDLAEPYLGVCHFLNAAKDNGIKISIVSHKTQYGHYDDARTNLHDAARSWLEANGILNDDLGPVHSKDLYFELTREAKIKRIQDIKCDMFVDDLPEVLLHPGFPKNVRKIWFADTQDVTKWRDLAAVRRWGELAHNLSHKAA